MLGDCCYYNRQIKYLKAMLWHCCTFAVVEDEKGIFTIYSNSKVRHLYKTHYLLPMRFHSTRGALRRA